MPPFSLPFWILASSSFLFFCAFAILSSSSSNSTTSFTPVRNVTFYGDAHFKNHSISLTKERSCLLPSPASSSNSSPSGIGRAFYIYPIRFLDPETNASVSFSCRFSFFILPAPFCGAGDGLAFLITSNAAYVPLPEDGHLGLPEIASSGSQDSFFAVEFDTSYDRSLSDLNGNHVGVDVNSPISFTSADVTSSGVHFKSGRLVTAWIDYWHAMKTVRVWLGHTRVRPPNPVLVAHIDLSKHFREFMHVGFSASNGKKGSAAHLVSHWRFKTSTLAVAPSKTVPMDSAVEEGDCFMCFPEDSDGRSPPSISLGKTRIGLRELLLGLGGFVALILSLYLILTIGCCMIRRRRSHSNRGQHEGRISRIQFNRVPTTLTLAEVKSATAGFNPSRVIGEGASATVYEGELPTGESVAVKRFCPVTRCEFFRDPFSTEFATMVSCLRHKNLVQLQGWCCEGNELVLVYEYLCNGSLDKILHENSISSGSSILTWERRLKIVQGIASALTYLHEECERQIIHRDVKSCNIMLDAEFNAKLGDFGLAEVYEHSSIIRSATIPAGTIGYLAPEYVYSGVPTEKTDVYSFGVVVLEVATGRMPVEDDGVAVTDWVWGLWERGKLVEAADPRLRRSYNVMEMKRMLMVGLCCVHPNCEKRPRVKEALRILRGEAQLPVLPARKPTVRIRSLLPEGSEELMNICGDWSPVAIDDPLWLTPMSHFSRD